MMDDSDAIIAFALTEKDVETGPSGGKYLSRSPEGLLNVARPFLG